MPHSGEELELGVEGAPEGWVMAGHGDWPASATPGHVKACSDQVPGEALRSHT